LLAITVPVANKSEFLAMGKRMLSFLSLAVALAVTAKSAVGAGDSYTKGDTVELWMNKVRFM
jgi:hypothetical protein